MSSDHTDRSGFAARYVESVALTWAGNLLRLVIGIVALKLVTTSIGESELGAYWIVTSVAALLAQFADLGLGLAAVRHIPLVRDAAHGRRLMQTMLILRFAVLALLCVAIYFLKPFVLRAFDAEVIASKYSYVYAFVIVTSLMEMYTNFLQGQNRFRAIALFAFVSSSARLALIFAMVRGMQLGIHGLFLSEVLAMALAALLSAWVSRPGLRLRFDGDEAKGQLRFGMPLYINSLLSYTANRINTIIIGSLSGPVGVSYFTVASRMPEQLSLVLRTYISVYLPNMTHLLTDSEPGRARHLLAASLRTMSFAFAMLTLVLSLFRYELLHLLAPPAYQAAAAAVPLLVGGLTFASLGSVMGHTIVALGDSKTPMLINFWTSLISVVLNIVLIQRWGFMGAAWAAFLFNLTAYAITDVVLARRLQPENRSYLLVLGVVALCLGVAFNAGTGMRLFVIAAAAFGSLAISPGLRADVGRVWRARRR